MSQKLYTLEEAHEHWNNTIQRCKKELQSSIKKHHFYTHQYERDTVTR